MENLDTFTCVACGIIVIASYFSWSYINHADAAKLKKNKKWIDQLPSIISTLGVLGTFVGITKGLWNFNASDLNNSIPTLLDGLKTAFFTSLCGMVGSMILSRTVSHKLDQEGGGSESEKAANSIVVALNRNHREFISKLEAESQKFVLAFKENDNIKGIQRDVVQLKDDVEEIKGLMQEIRTAMDNIQNSSGACAEEMPRLRAVVLTATTSVTAIDNHVADISSAVESIERTAKDIKDGVEDINTI